MDSARRLPAPNRDELIALGLLDPESAEAHDRELLLQFLIARGATLDELERSREFSDLIDASIDQTVRPGPRLTRREVAWRSGLDDDVLVQLRQAMGLADPGQSVAFYTEADVLAARAFERIALLFGEAVALQLTRVAGAALARITEAAVGAFVVNVETPLRATGTSEMSMGRAFAELASGIPDVGRLLETQLRHHMERAMHECSLASRDPLTADLVTITVGCIDVVGPAVWARSLTPSLHAGYLATFARLVGAVVSDHGGHVVKVVGDAATFVVDDPATACRIALDVIERAAAQGALPPLRAGIASGTVIRRDGDYHGEPVQLAAQLANVSEPDAVLVVRQAIAGTDTPIDLTWKLLGVQTVRGSTEPLEIVAAVRREKKAA